MPGLDDKRMWISSVFYGAPGGGGGDSEYERGGDARRLAVSSGF